MKIAVILAVFIAMTSFASAAPSAEAQKPLPVSGVGVSVKNKSANQVQQVVTDVRGNFSLVGLKPGAYTLTFRVGEPVQGKNVSSSKATVSDTFAINIAGLQRPAAKTNITGQQLGLGVEMPITVESGANIRGQVVATETRRMVWIVKEPGSNIPGHWAEADSPEAKAAFKSNAYGMTQDGLQRMFDRAGDIHQPGSPVSPIGAGRNLGSGGAGGGRGN